MDGSAATQVLDVPVVPYASLRRADSATRSTLRSAIGTDGLGIISVSDIPGFSEMRRRLLPLAKRLAAQPLEVLARLEDEASQYNVGWSFGRELLDGHVDTRKGSFYANPNMDVPTEDVSLIERYPCYCRPNVWPAPGGDLEELEPAFKELGQLMYQVGMELLDACLMDERVEFNRDTVSDPACSRGRLLCYLPEQPEVVKVTEMSMMTSRMWCGWHTDHGSLTALCPAIYLDDGGREVACPVGRPGGSEGPSSPGLHIRTRSGALVRASIKQDALAFQVGEALERISGGALGATPHCVVASESRNLTRCTLALFMQPRWSTVLDESGMTFGEFSGRRLNEAYSLP
jgi:isopenicillin N synthase-like dioxygenase